MKIIKGLWILVVTIVLGSCFDPPEFPNVPQIEFQRVEFLRGQGRDSLVVYITFKDGDGDLGLDPEDPKYNSVPFNNTTYYQATGSTLTPLNYTSHQVDYLDKKGKQARIDVNILDIETPLAGDLVFPRTRFKPGYTNLPPYTCTNYEFLEASNL